MAIFPSKHLRSRVQTLEEKLKRGGHSHLNIPGTTKGMCSHWKRLSADSYLGSSQLSPDPLLDTSFQMGCIFGNEGHLGKPNHRKFFRPLDTYDEKELCSFKVMTCSRALTPYR
jgi:hypothetical protein